MTPERITAIRTAAGLNKSQLARQLGVAYATVKKWEQGKQMPHPVFREKLAQIEKHGANHA